MPSSQTPGTPSADAAQDAQSLTAPAGLNLLGTSDSAAGCCGADGCCSL